MLREVVNWETDTEGGGGGGGRGRYRGRERDTEREQRTCEEFWKHNASVGWVLYAFGVYGLLWIKPLYAFGVCDLINSRLQDGRLTFVVPNS